MPIIGMIVDLIAPSLPAIAKDLHVSDSMVKNTITTFLIGYAVGNFFTGFLTDALGRQKLLRLSLLGFIAVSTLPIIHPDIKVLLISRLLQGITMGAAAVLLRAIFSDILPKERLVHLGAILGITWGLGPIFGPIIGGYLQHYFGWKSCFYFFTIISSISFIATFLIVPETHSNKQPLKISVIKNNILEIISNPVFIALPILMGIAYSLIISFHTSGPFLVQDVMHYSAIFFGKLALCMGIGYLISTLAAKWLLKYFSVEEIFKVSLIVFLLVALVGLIISYSFPYSVVLLVVISIVMFAATGVLFPLSMGKGLSMFSHVAGTATAIMYLINGIITSATSFIVSLIKVHNTTIIMWIYFILITISTVVFWVLIHRNSDQK